MEGLVAQNIRDFRYEKGLTQSELAKETGLCRNTIVNFETARRDPRVKDLRKIAIALDVSIEQLLANKQQ